MAASIGTQSSRHISMMACSLLARKNILQSAVAALEVSTNRFSSQETIARLGLKKIIAPPTGLLARLFVVHVASVKPISFNSALGEYQKMECTQDSGNPESVEEEPHSLRKTSLLTQHLKSLQISTDESKIHESSKDLTKWEHIHQRRTSRKRIQVSMK